MKARKSNRTESRFPLSVAKPETASQKNGRSAGGAGGGNGGSASAALHAEVRDPGDRSAEGGNGGSASAERPVTEVVAKGDVGFGNSLFIRGEGDGLSWDRGTPLACTGPSTWVWSATQARDKVVFKLLLNDQIWAKGEDIMVNAGQRVEIVPGF
jgi:hypothetical protein